MKNYLFALFIGATLSFTGINGAFAQDQNINGTITAKGMVINGQGTVGGNFFSTNMTANGGFFGKGLTINGDGTVGGNFFTSNITANGNLFSKGLNVNGQSSFAGPVFIGNGGALQTVNVNGNVFLHNQLVVGGLTILGGLPPIAVPLQSKYCLYVLRGIVSEDYVIAPTSQWADYVFHDDYKRPSLKEVAKFIQVNKHLEGVPTTTEVAENGYSMRDVNVTLLRKVEELTLYTIEQDKKATEQDKKIITQQQQLKQLAIALAELKVTITKLK